MMDRNAQNNGFSPLSEVMELDTCPLIDDGAETGTTDGAQMVAVASYTNPLGDPAAWQRLISYDSKKLSILVANVLNGPDYVVEKNWASVI